MWLVALVVLEISALIVSHKHLVHLNVLITISYHHVLIPLMSLCVLVVIYLQKTVSISHSHPSGKAVPKVLFDGISQGRCPVSGVRWIWEKIQGNSWPVDGPARIELTPSLVLRPSSDGAHYYILAREDKSLPWTCGCQGFKWRHQCSHVNKEQEQEALHSPSDLIQHGGFRPWLD